MAIGLWIVCSLAFGQEKLQGPTNFDFETIEALTQQGGGVLTAMLGDPELRASRLQMSYRLDRQGVFRGKFMVCNHTDYKLDYGIFALVDYQQQAFELNKRVADSHRLFLPQAACTTDAVVVPFNGSGIHDLIFVGVRYQNRGTQVMDPPPEFQLISHRATLTKGEAGFPETPLFGIVESAASVNDKNIQLHCSFHNAESNATETPRIYAKVANPNEYALKVALVFFADKTQIQMSSGNSKQSLFFTLKPNKSTEIEIDPALLDSAEQLWALMIENPYTVLEPEPGVMVQRPIDIRKSNVIQTKTCFSPSSNTQATETKKGNL